MGFTIDRRARLAEASPQRLAWPLRLAGARAWAVVLTLAGLTALADLLTGRESWFGPIYLLVIGIATWSLGWRQGFGIGLACLGVGIAGNGLWLYPYGGVAVVWNLAMRLGAVLMAIALLHHLRQSYGVQWRMARTDPLTGALNRQAFFELAGAATRSRGWNLLVYADLDGLKRLNDELGHLAGDEGLRAFARHVLTTIRKEDVFARVGGDEFLVHLQVRDEQAGLEVSARLYGEMNAVFAAADSRLRCSVGALILAPGERSIDRELRQADRRKRRPGPTLRV